MHLLNKNFIQLLKEEIPVQSENPIIFESLGVAYGYVLYSTHINFLATSPAILNVSGLRDRAYVYVDGVIELQQLIFFFCFFLLI